MAVPKSVTKIIKKDGKNEVTFTTNIDRLNYTLNELTRAALRDSGKYIAKMFKDDYYSFFDKQTGSVGKFAQYWVRKKENDLQVGIKPNAFYGGFQEKGTEKQPALGMLTHAAEDNIAEIVRIQSQYLSALESEAEALALIDEEEYEGNADE